MFFLYSKDKYLFANCDGFMKTLKIEMIEARIWIYTCITCLLVHCAYLSCLLVHVYLQYAKESQHEKILRGLAVGIALTMYGREEEADPLIDSLQVTSQSIVTNCNDKFVSNRYLL